MAMMAHEAPTSPPGSTSSVLPTASLCAMKWPKPRVDSGVHVHFSSSKGIGMRAQPAVGWPFSVWRLEARLSHALQRRLVQPRVAARLRELHAGAAGRRRRRRRAPPPGPLRRGGARRAGTPARAARGTGPPRPAIPWPARVAAVAWQVQAAPRRRRGGSGGATGTGSRGGSGATKAAGAGVGAAAISGAGGGGAFGTGCCGGGAGGSGGRSGAGGAISSTNSGAASAIAERTGSSCSRPQAATPCSARMAATTARRWAGGRSSHEEAWSRVTAAVHEQ